MNIHLLIRSLLGKATCVRESSSVIKPNARIINASSHSSSIRIGNHSIVEGELFVFGHGGDISIGQWCFIGPGSRIWSDTSVRIGDRVLISHNVNIFDNLTHPINARERHRHFLKIATSGHPKILDLAGNRIDIGDDVWIGAGATIMRGVTVGEGAIIGAASVVTQNVPSGAIVAGNPARIVRQLQPADYVFSPI